MRRDNRVRILAVGYLVVQGVGVIGWWLALWLFPSIRTLFLAPGAPETTLLASVGGDLLLYAGGSFLAALGIARKRWWAWGAVCVVAGAGVYAGLYGLGLLVASGGREWLGAVLMLPSLVVMPLLVWRLRPEVGA